MLTILYYLATYIMLYLYVYINTWTPLSLAGVLRVVEVLSNSALVKCFFFFFFITGARSTNSNT